MNTFERSKSIGEIGENKALDILSNMGYKVQDVRNIPFYQQRDIDFRTDRRLNNVGDAIHYINGKDDLVDIEVKTDRVMSRTKNIFIEYSVYNQDMGSEYVKYRETGELVENGWYYKTKAEVIMYYDMGNNFFYFISMKKLRENIKENKYTWKDVRNPSDNSRIVGQVIPIIDLIKDKTCFWGYDLTYNNIGRKYNYDELCYKYRVKV